MITKNKAVHICVLNRNVGDNALNLAIEKMFFSTLDITHMELLRNKFEADKIKRLNQGNLVIFGGGGLIHARKPNGSMWQRTGTMWNIKLDDLKKIQTPIVLYGCGFNEFYNEGKIPQKMEEFFNILVEKNALISFRNDKSKNRFTKALPQFKDYIQTIPDPGIFFRVDRKKQDKPYVALQIAADRVNLRYKKGFDHFLKLIKIIANMVEYDIVLIPHTVDDEFLYKTIKLPNVKIFPLLKKVEDTHRVIELYANAEFSISTRGHSQICSIGNGTPTFAISTHPKVKGFMEECMLDDYCYDYMNESKNTCLDKFKHFLSTYDNQKETLHTLNEKFNKEIDEFNLQVLSL